MRTGFELTLIVIALCASTWRATRLLVKDDLPPVKKPREALVRRATRPDGSLRWYGELVTCPWCVSVWLAAVFTLVTDLLVGLPVPVLMFGLIAAFAATYEDLTTRGRCPEIDVQQLVRSAIDEDPGWQRYAVRKLGTTYNTSNGQPQVMVHGPRGFHDVDTGRT